MGGIRMHELGILRQIVKVVKQVADTNSIEYVKHITLEVGLDSGIVLRYMEKLFPVAVDSFPFLKNAELRIRSVRGRGLIIKDIGF